MKNKISKLIYTLLLCSAFIFTSCYSWYEEKVDLDNKTTQVSLADFLYEPEKITNLDSPDQLIVSQGMYSGIVKLHWTDVPHASSYRVERAVVSPDSNGKYTYPDEGAFEVLEKYVFNTNFNDHILADPKSDSDYSNRYYYRVSAENIPKGYESSDFTGIGEGWLLAPPKNLTAWKGKSDASIQVSWDNVVKATGYQIYRGEKANGSGMELLDTVKANQNKYINTVESSEQGVDFYYKVVAVLPNNSLSASTELTLGYAKREGAPVSPASVKVENANGESISSLTISWDAVDSKDNYTTYYSVFRTSSANSTLKQVKKETQDTKFTDTDNLEPGMIYYYYVQSIYKNDLDTLKSEFSDTGPEPESTDIESAYGYLLSPPSDVELTDGDSKDTVIMKWTPAIRYTKKEVTDPFSYRIEYSDKKDGEFLTLCETDSLEIENGYYSKKVSKKNFYRIVTINKVKNLNSNPSIIVAPTPNAPATVTVSKTSNLDGLENYKYNNNEVYPVQITWTAPTEDNPSGYHIYRSTTPNSGYRRITDSVLSSSERSFIDENETARPGTYYYYKVVSLNVLGQGNKGNIDYGYGAITRNQWFREYNKTIMKSQTKLTLMHKANDMDKLGSETISGDLSGTLSYNASIAGLGAEITMHYENYSDYNILNNPSFGKYFVITGNTDTTSNMSANGNMHGTVNCTGMYPGYAKYDNLQIKGGAAGGGYYIVETKDINGKTLLSEDNVDWTVGEEK